MSWSLYTISIALMVIFSSFLTRIIPFMIFAILTIVFLHWWKKNSLLSISGGTLIYMLCVQYKIYNFF